MGNDQKKPQQAVDKAQYHPDIIVVSNRANNADSKIENSEVNKLQYIPTFYPILKSSIELKEDRALLVLKENHIKELVHLMRNHLSVSAFNVNKDQEAIFLELKNLNFIVDLLTQNFFDKQKKYARFCEQLKVVDEMRHDVRKIQRNLDETLGMMKELNDLLPENERLESLSTTTD